MSLTEELLAFIDATEAKKGFSPQQARQMKNALEALSKKVSIDLLSVEKLDNELLSNHMMKFRGLTDSTLSNYRSSLRKLFDSFKNRPKNGEVNIFRERLSKLAIENPKLYSKVRKYIGGYKIDKILAGEPMQKDASIESLCRYLNLSDSEKAQALAAMPPKIGKPAPTKRGILRGTYKTDPVPLIMDKWPASAKKEWNWYVQFRNTSQPGVLRPTKKLAKTTVKIKLEAWQKLFGYATKFHGVNVKDLSVVLLFDEKLINGLVKHYKTKGHLKGMLFSLANMVPMLDPKTGFVNQLEAIIGDKAYFEKNYLKDMTRDEWKDKCFKYYAYLKNTYSDVRADSGSGKTKDHLERIEDIYKLPNPLKPVEEMLERMLKHHIEGDIKQENYYRARAMAIFGLMIECPLRAKNIVNLVDSKSETSECLFFEKGRWHLLVPAAATKNKKTIEVSLHPNSNCFINPFWELKQKAGNTGGKFFELTDQSHLGATMTKYAASYIPEHTPKGINPHGMRHLVGTYCAKIGLGMEVAAGMLFDEIVTVAKYYAHLQPQELADKYFEKKYGKT